MAGAAVKAFRYESRWLVLHGGLRLLSRREARRGNPVARLVSDPQVRDDPYPMYAETRQLGRVVATKLMHVTADHGVVSGILRDSQSFGVQFADSAAVPVGLRWALKAPDPELATVIEPPSLLAVDPPTHTRYRRLVSKPFTPRALQQVADRVEERAAELLDGLAGRRQVDIVTEYAELLPVAVIAEILGVPADMHAQFLAWGHEGAPVLDIGLRHRTFHQVKRSVQAMNAWFDEHFANLRRHPGDDILSQLVNADPEERLTDLELRATAMLLLGAGFETTVNLLGTGVAVLAPDEKSRGRLAADPELWPQAIDELLRFDSPVQLTGRVALADTEVDGVPIKRGTPLVLLLGGANRDPATFPNPDVYDLDRPNSREHVAFSGGVHYCLGANLAKMEGASGLRLLFERFPDLQVVPASGVRRDLQTLRGYRRLLVNLAG
ncbi:MAG TPA: cytochrome P450 [Mycobacteriales bacterium]|nr:cytochrome P450 [Mycobacteriales bacterium]